jgi:glucose uptake protein
MILPTDPTTVLVLLLAAFFCLASWANTYKMTSPWRFELYYFDYALGVLLIGVLSALTLGSMGDDLSFSDNLLIAGKRNMAYAIAAGAVFNFGNLLFMAGLSLAGMSLAFPAAYGTALVVVNLLRLFESEGHGKTLLLASTMLALATILCITGAARAFAQPEGRPAKAGTTLKLVLLSVLAGIPLGLFQPLMKWARAPEIGLASYATVFFFSIGIFLSTFVYNLYFCNLPVEGRPVGLVDYFRTKFKFHVLGLMGGAIWCSGLLCSLVALESPRGRDLWLSVQNIVLPSFPVAGALYGLVVWRELRDVRPSVRLLVLLALVCFLAAIFLSSQTL